MSREKSIFDAKHKQLGSVIQELYANLMATSAMEFFAVIFGILSVWFARRENIWVYPTGIINVLLYVVLCYQAGLYADMGINAFYFVMSVYGWYNWARRDGQGGHEVSIGTLSRKEWLIYPLLTLVAFVILYFLLKQFTDSTVPWYDSFTTALFIAGMWLMAQKKIENWLAWIIGDLLVIPLFAYKHLVFTSVQYMVFLVLAMMGYMEWSKRLKANNP